MQITYMKAMLTVAWMLAIAVLGYAAGTTTVAGWTVLVAVALTPPVIMMRFWGVPSQSMSESIQDVLRQ